MTDFERSDQQDFYANPFINDPDLYAQTVDSFSHDRFDLPVPSIDDVTRILDGVRVADTQRSSSIVKDAFTAERHNIIHDAESLMIFTGVWLRNEALAAKVARSEDTPQ